MTEVVGSDKQTRLIREVAESIKGWRTLEHAWWLKTYHDTNQEMWSPEDEKTWDTQLAIKLQRLAQETGLSESTLLQSVQVWLDGGNGIDSD